MVNKMKTMWEAGECDCVYSNVVGDSIVAFRREFINQGLSYDKFPIFATVCSEIEVQAMGPDYAAGSVTSFPYFQSVSNPANEKFVEDVKRTMGDDTVTYHAMECAYFQVFLWAQSVEKAGEVDPLSVREASKGQEVDAPEGRVRIEPENLHCWLTPRIGVWGSDGQAEIVDEYAEPLMPLPYSAYGEAPDNLFCTQAGLDSSKLKT